MSSSLALNLIGLAFITFGAIAGALSAPAPQYNADGSVSLAPQNSTKERRMAIHKRQKMFPAFLASVGIGASLQAVALFIPPVGCG
jgi:hypothetical protein